MEDIPVEALRRPRRVPSRAIAEVIDEILRLIGDSSAAPVYRLLACRLGIHTTTLLRYHQQRLRSAPRPVLTEATRVLDEVRRTGDLPLAQKGSETCCKPKQARIPAWRLAHQLDRLVELTELSEPSALHRLLAIRTGVHATTVLRFHRNVLRSAPEILLDVANDLERRARSGEAIRFPHGGDGTPVVTRMAFAEAVDNLVETGLFPNRNALLHRIEDDLDIVRGRLTRLYRCRTFRWVPGKVLDILEELERQVQYDPSRSYDPGERLHHHLFGPGTVTEKLPLKKIVVRFDDGRSHTLREQLREDTYWRQANNSPGPGEAFNFGSYAR